MIFIFVLFVLVYVLVSLACAVIFLFGLLLCLCDYSLILFVFICHYTSFSFFFFSSSFFILRSLLHFQQVINKFNSIVQIYFTYFRWEPEDDPSFPAPMDDGMTDVVQHDLSAEPSSANFYSNNVCVGGSHPKDPGHS